ncbi:tyrosine-type recombinase/integrase [Reyranella sp.]|uniref:tyrosine-type recombinase/integrase n=1 Tax=Reyranella sp. TaxID=1929291 RepID=UPI0037850F10
MAYVSVPNVRGLVRQRRRYWYRAAIPEDVRGHFGNQSTHWANLHTDDLRTATARVHRAASDFRSKVLEARGRVGTVEEDALAWRQMIAEARRDAGPDDRSGPDATDLVDAAIREASRQHVRGGYAAVERSARLFHDGSEGDALLELGGPKAKTFVSIALEGRQPLFPFVSSWSAVRTTEVQDKTASMDKAAALRFVEAFPLVSDVTSEAVADWIAKRRGEVSGATVQREVSGLKAFWGYLQSRGEVPKDQQPFAGQRFKDRRKDKAAAKRQAFTPKEVSELHAAALKTEDQELADLIAVLAMSGMRREEACALKVADVSGGWASIQDAKSEAGWRSLPIAKPLAPVIRRLIGKRTTGYVFDGLDADRFGHRGDAVGKRFTRLKQKLGHGDTKTAHSIRHTVQQLLRAAGEHPDVVSDVLGHHVATVTGGTYGTPEARKRLLPAALAKLSYPGTLKAPV